MNEWQVSGALLPLSEIAPDHADATFNVNVTGTIFTVKRSEADGGRRFGILTGSTTGVMGTPAFSVYSASKAAVRHLARSGAQDLRGTGIRVNVLSPAQP